MFPPCRVHITYQHAGIYKRNMNGKLLKVKRGIHKGERILVPIEDTWVCPWCRVVFLKPKSFKRLTKPKRRKKNNVKYH